jgi:UDP-GlcNAc3NAcA epimerase
MLDSALEPELLQKVTGSPLIKIIPPASFLEVTLLESKARIVITDSGGVQKEAYFFKKPGVVLRHETEWAELISQGTCLLADADTEKIVQSVNTLLSKTDLAFPPLFGDGNAAGFICGELIKQLKANRLQA